VYICDNVSRSVLLRMRNVSDESCVKKIKTHILFSINSPPPRKLYRLWDNVEKYCRAGQATWQYNWAHALCMLNTKGYKDTLRKCNTHCFCTATMVTRTRFNVTLHIYCLFCICMSLSFSELSLCSQIMNYSPFSLREGYTITSLSPPLPRQYHYLNAIKPDCSRRCYPKG
jgi:hypothetical protein